MTKQISRFFALLVKLPGNWNIYPAADLWLIWRINTMFSFTQLDFFMSPPLTCPAGAAQKQRRSPRPQHYCVISEVTDWENCLLHLLHLHLLWPGKHTTVQARQRVNVRVKQCSTTANWEIIIDKLFYGLKSLTRVCGFKQHICLQWVKNTRWEKMSTCCYKIMSCSNWSNCEFQQDGLRLLCFSPFTPELRMLVWQSHEELMLQLQRSLSEDGGWSVVERRRPADIKQSLTFQLRGEGRHLKQL